MGQNTFGDYGQTGNQPFCQSVCGHKGYTPRHVLEWYNLKLNDPKKLDGLNLNHKAYPKAEASVYIGCAHNPCDIHQLTFTYIHAQTFLVQGNLTIGFEYEGVAPYEVFEFEINILITA